MKARLALAGAGVLLAAGCAGGVPSGMIPPAPSASTLLPSSTATSDLTGVTLAAVPGRTTTTVAIKGGGASLSGTVIGPPGPVGGAEVHVERITSQGVASEDAVTGPDGSWSISGLLGGRYRVRAWRAPDLDLTTPAILFLGDSESRAVPLTLTSFTGTMVSSAVNPAPVAEVPFNIAVVVAAGAVDTSGVARANPAAFTKVELSATSDMTLNTINPGYTDATGRVQWEAVCHTPGPLGVSIVVNDTDTVTLNLPACSPGASTTTAASPSTTG